MKRTSSISIPKVGLLIMILANFSAQAATDNIAPMLEEALATIPDAERKAVVMHHLQDRSYHPFLLPFPRRTESPLTHPQPRITP